MPKKQPLVKQQHHELDAYGDIEAGTSQCLIPVVNTDKLDALDCYDSLWAWDRLL